MAIDDRYDESNQERGRRNGDGLYFDEQKNTREAERRIPAVRLGPAPQGPHYDATKPSLGPLTQLAGTWEGNGFNMIGRPDHEGKAPVFLELNQTKETLAFTPITTNIPNRGNGQDDINLFGLTYLQQVSDAVTKGALHIEPGIWVTVPSTTDPSLPPTVARMASIPHGNAVLAEGTAVDVASLPGGTFPVGPVNTAPFPLTAPPTPPPAPGTQSGFPAYNLSDHTAAAVEHRTPFLNVPPIALPTSIDGVPMQTVINDPTRLLQKAISGLDILSMTVLTISTKPGGTTGGGVENIPFLRVNADAAQIDAIFWIETIKHPVQNYLQLQYVQTVMLNFPILTAGKPPVPFSWPHVSVATLWKTWGGQ